VIFLCFLNVNIYIPPLLTLNPNAVLLFFPKMAQWTGNKWKYFTNSTSLTKCHTTQTEKQLELINQLQCST